MVSPRLPIGIVSPGWVGRRPSSGALPMFAGVSALGRKSDGPAGAGPSSCRRLLSALVVLPDANRVQDRLAVRLPVGKLDGDLTVHGADERGPVKGEVPADERGDVERDQVRIPVHDHVELALARALVLDLGELELQLVDGR